MVTTIKEVSSSNPSCQDSVYMYSLLPFSPKYRLHISDLGMSPVLYIFLQDASIFISEYWVFGKNGSKLCTRQLITSLSEYSGYRLQRWLFLFWLTSSPRVLLERNCSVYKCFAILLDRDSVAVGLGVQFVF